MRLLCPAKINLHLRVGPVRGDGFHPLLSWFATAGLFDNLILSPSSASSGPRAGGALITLECDQPDLPTDGSNLVVKAGEAFARDIAMASGKEPVAVHANLAKKIPAGAGLGGGSSNGAKTLAGLNVLWRAQRSADFLSEFAGRFGSDLSFFFHGPSSICSGRGEVVRPVPRPAPRAALLILPPIVMPTAAVYRRFDELRLGRMDDIVQEPSWLAWSTLSAGDLLTKLANDLETPAFSIAPELDALRRSLERGLGRVVRMSGSGSSLFTLYDTLEQAAEAQARLATEPLLPELRSHAVELAPGILDDLHTPTSGDDDSTEENKKQPVEEKHGWSPRFYDTPGDPSFSYWEEPDEKQ